MDELTTMVTSVQQLVPADWANAWFGAVATAYEQSGADWATFTEALRTAAGEQGFGDEVVEVFVRSAEDNIGDPIGVVGQMCENWSALPAWYASLVSGERAAETTGAGSTEGAAEWDNEVAAQWYEHLTSANQWPGWTGGGPAEWDQFRQWFLYYAELSQVQAPAARFLERVDGAGGYGAGLAACGIQTVGAPPETAAPAYGAADGRRPAEPAPAAVAEKTAEIAQSATADLTDVSADEVHTVVAELLQEFPELADIPEDRRRELMEELLQEVSASS